MDRLILFTCPRTGMNVQDSLAAIASRDAEDTLVGVPCPACGSVHFVSSRTGKLLTERRDQRIVPIPREQTFEQE